MPVDPFVVDPAANYPGTGIPRERHRPVPDVRGFRRENALARLSAALGQKGFNSCERCGEPLPRDTDSDWRYAGTCPSCGQVQIWAG
jgi:predicted RNA-binding Zn-ribbon protein involved in translation (DUF1610 family)